MTKVRTTQLAQTGASLGQALVWTAGGWVPAAFDDATKIPKALVDAKGDLLVASAADTVIRLAVGANNTALVADSTAPGGVKWAAPFDPAAIPAAIVDEPGDLIVGSGSNTVVRLARGAPGQRLTSSTEGLLWDAVEASEVAFVPFGTIEATNVQAALEELSEEGGSGGGGGGGHVIKDEGVTLAQRADLDFVGTGVSVYDDPVLGKTVVQVTGVEVTAAAFIRASTNVVTPSVAANASWTGLLPLQAGYRLYSIATSRPARVRIYDTVASRDADLSRAVTSEVPLGAGLMLEYVTVTGSLSASLSPLVDGYVVTGTDAPISIVNLGSTGTITVTLTYVRTE